MSTRSRTRSNGLTGKGMSTASTSQAKPKSHRPAEKDMDVVSEDGKENVNLKTPAMTTANIKKGKVKKEPTRDSLRPVDCICTRGDDGSPMIHCSECKIWYHFTCVDMSEPEAEEVSVYICPTCTATTRRRSAMTWEGDQAIEECTDDEAIVMTRRRKAALQTRKKSAERKFVAEESEETLSSDDEYVEDNKEFVGKNKTLAKRHRRLSNISDSDSADETKKRRLTHIKVSASPPPSANGHANLKRKATHTSVSRPSPAHKRKRSASSYGLTAADDPARKYCLGKLEELFQDIFLRYPHVRVPVGADEGGNNMDVEEDTKSYIAKIGQKKPEELSEEEKEASISKARQFANELESCVFDTYSEPDKAGQPHAGGKYKERFRMLQFNLSKVDRVIIHQRITSGNISAKEISLMSSTDLADEETKQSIKQAEKEALEHSILLKSTVPRAKITHKGLQDIEDVNLDVASAREIERLKEREHEEEERRERERMARLRTVQRQRTASISVPPESPTVLQTPTSEQEWGAPPPVPPHAMSPPTVGRTEEMQGGISRPPLFLQTSSDANIEEPELNLADLINIDEEQEPTRTSAEQPSTTGLQGNSGPDLMSLSADISQPSPTSAIPTGISPFAARPDRPRVGSFDLSSLWNAPKEAPLATTEPVVETAPAPTLAFVEEAAAEGSDKEDAMDLESVEANDQDFDMFLEENQPESPSDLIVTPIPLQVETLPQVWTGKITMPLDSSVPQETALVARQVAGRTLAPDSPLWRTLFPSEQLRIEGRVPVENSVKYLLQMRMNATKELYAAAFVPASLAHAEDFKTFCNFLISKSRHGLVFPWGSRPKDYHPGRELYMVPLLQTDPLPEFVELLDDLKLPKIRSKDYLLGIWILNKGKLAPPPGTAAQSEPAPQTKQPIQQVQTPPIAQTLPLNAPMYHPSPPGPLISHLVGTPNQPPPIPIASAALAAEVASLTPEQLQEVIRTLAATTQVTSPPFPGQMPPIPQPPHLFNQNRPFPPNVPAPPGPNHTPAPPNQQPWIHPPPPNAYPMNYPPPNVPFQQPPRGMNSSPVQPPYDRQDYDRDFRPGPHYSQANRGNPVDRGWRGNPSHRGGPNRGRGRGGGDGYDRDFNARRPSDSGWSRRQSQGGPAW